MRLDINGATPVVHASGTAIATVIDVLVDNAVRHGSGTVTITLGAARPSGVSVTVADEGELAGDPNRVFERRSPEARGHGIGLALARSLAHAEGARLRLARRSPTTFELLIGAAAPVTRHEIAVG
jgi:signal transduction histidine kinase